MNFEKTTTDYMIEDDTLVNEGFNYSVKDAKEYKVKKVTDLSPIDFKAKAFFTLCKVRKTLRLNKFDLSSLNILISKIAADPAFKGTQYEDYVKKFSNLVYFKENDIFDFEFSYEKD